MPAIAHVRNGVQIVPIQVRDRLSLAQGLRTWRRAATAAIASLEPDVVHGQGLLVCGLPTADIIGKPRVVTAHGNLEQDTLASFRGPAGFVRAHLRDRLVRNVVRRIDQVISVHPDWRINLPAEPRRFSYIPNIVADAYFQVTAAPEPGRVLYCGGDRLIKGWDMLFAAWPKICAVVPDATLCATGFVDERLERVPARASIRGLVSASVLADEMARASCVVIPSRFEVAPMVLAEAWAVGVPVVAAAVGGVTTLGEGAAMLVPREDPGALASAVAGVLRSGANADLIEEGRRRAALFTASQVAEAHLAVYMRLASGYA